MVVVGTSCCGKTTFARRLAAALEQPHIELDALYWRPVWPRATAIFWLNYSFMTVFTRALERTFRRALRAEPLYAGNRETLTRSLLTRDSILWWIIRTFRPRRRDYEEVRASRRYPRLEWHELRDPDAAERALREIQARMRGSGDDGA